jgi:hypothetical protein
MGGRLTRRACDLAQLAADHQVQRHRFKDGRATAATKAAAAPTKAGQYLLGSNQNKRGLLPTTPRRLASGITP